MVVLPKTTIQVLSLKERKEYFHNIILNVANMNNIIIKQHEALLKEKGYNSYKELQDWVNYIKDIAMAYFERSEIELDEIEFKQLNDYIIHFCKMFKVNLALQNEININPPFEI
tara:strand:+ start:273 stop:614 length:342 start_codon:yes stop_codon:yes gene_type:complete